MRAIKTTYEYVHKWASFKCETRKVACSIIVYMTMHSQRARQKFRYRLEINSGIRTLHESCLRINSLNHYGIKMCLKCLWKLLSEVISMQLLSVTTASFSSFNTVHMLLTKHTYQPTYCLDRLFHNIPYF